MESTSSTSSCFRGAPKPALLFTAAVLVAVNTWQKFDAAPPAARTLPVVLVDEDVVNNSASSSSLFEVVAGAKTSSYLPTEIRPRAFDRWNSSVPLPCVEEGSSWGGIDRGFVFPRPQKAGSSTGSSINIRIARGVARRFMNIEVNDEALYCKWRHHHGVPRKDYGGRDRDRSFLWSIVRDPTSRLVSQFFHFGVARENRSLSDDSFLDFVETRTRRHYYMSFFSRMIDNTLPRRFDPELEDPVDTINAILRSYDFLAVTERVRACVYFVAGATKRMNDILIRVPSSLLFFASFPDGRVCSRVADAAGVRMLRKSWVGTQIRSTHLTVGLLSNSPPEQARYLGRDVS